MQLLLEKVDDEVADELFPGKSDDESRPGKLLLENCDKEAPAETLLLKYPEEEACRGESLLSELDELRIRDSLHR